MRSLLFVPADRPRLVERAVSSSADAVALDLEDAVAPAHKQAALENAIGAIRARGDTGPQLWIRINSGSAGRDELETILDTCNPSGVWLPKAEPGDPHTTDAVASLSMRPMVGIGLLIETAIGLDGLSALLATVPNDRARVGLGEEDLRADLRIPSPGDESIASALRSQVVLRTARWGLPKPVGPVWTNLADIDGFRRSCLQLRFQGFGGRVCIHPDQVDVANTSFSPSKEELDSAAAMLAEHKERVLEGEGVFRDSLGRMVDEATIKQARNLLGYGDANA
ncbi:hypothetical protein ASG90_01035 [Nocardioides sp. Soil797]|nr:hypothetical protein ASG90_01035 [Nocardioides sp. Soil797]